MDIKDKITEWQEFYLSHCCISRKEASESNQELDLVLYAIDTLTDMKSVLREDPVVMMQYRFKIMNEDCVDYGEWYPWQLCDKVKYNDIKSYIDIGKDQYEVRELIVK